MNKDFIDKYENIRKIILSKIEKSKKYKQTDFLILANTLNHRIKGNEYYSFEFMLSLDYLEIFKDTNIIACIFI